MGTRRFLLKEKHSIHDNVLLSIGVALWTIHAGKQEACGDRHAVEEQFSRLQDWRDCPMLPALASLQMRQLQLRQARP